MSKVQLKSINIYIQASFKNKNNPNVSNEKEKLILKIKKLTESFKSGDIGEEEYEILERVFIEKLRKLEGN